LRELNKAQKLDDSTTVKKLFDTVPDRFINVWSLGSKNFTIVAV
jgi:hypothetical protein